MAAAPGDPRRPPTEVDDVVEGFDGARRALVLLEEFPLEDPRPVVAVVRRSVLEPGRSGARSVPDVTPISTERDSRRRRLVADHRRFRLSLEPLDGFLGGVRGDDPGAHRRALGQYGRARSRRRSVATARRHGRRSRGRRRIPGLRLSPPPRETIISRPARPLRARMVEKGAEAIWVEKYRPRSLQEMVGQEAIVPLLRSYAAKRSMPHLLFAGPPGTGKTTAALALARDLYGPEWRQNFLELNASDSRGIDTVRTTIKEYARTSPFGEVGFKILFLDEADNLTSEAQASLRRMMERYSGSCRFILSCNYSSRIIDPIQSRCAVFRFRAYSTDAVRTQLERVAKAEGKKIAPDAMETILAASAGDLRRAVNLLQLTSTHTDQVTAETVKEYATVPLRREVEAMLSAALAGRFLEARDRLYRVFTERGASGEDILRAIHSYLPDIPESVLSAREKVRLVEYLGEVDFRLAEGASDRIQLEAVLAHVAAGRPEGK